MSLEVWAAKPLLQIVGEIMQIKANAAKLTEKMHTLVRVEQSETAFAITIKPL